MSTTRIYTVSSEEEFYLVEASTKQAALRHIASRRFNVGVATPKVIVAAMSDGVKVEVAGDALDPVEQAQAA